MAALKNDVRLESRQLKVALEKFGELFDSLREGNQQLTRELTINETPRLTPLSMPKANCCLRLWTCAIDCKPV